MSLAEARFSQQQLDSVLAMDGRDFHILAVDDSHLDRKVVERLLVNSSYKVTTVDSALRALEVLGIVGTTASPMVINAVKINLIITDYCMPEMTGYDLLKKVKESSALKEIPVVIMSSENVAERVTMCLAEGAKEFILKPLRPADVKRLRSHIKNEDGDFVLEECASASPKRIASTVPACFQSFKRQRTTNVTPAMVNISNDSSNNINRYNNSKSSIASPNDTVSEEDCHVAERYSEFMKKSSESVDCPVPRISSEMMKLEGRTCEKRSATTRGEEAREAGSASTAGTSSMRDDEIVTKTTKTAVGDLTTRDEKIIARETAAADVTPGLTSAPSSWGKNFT